MRSWINQRRWMHSLQHRPALRLEVLEDRCVPSTAAPFDLAAGLDPDDFLTDAIFANSEQVGSKKGAVLATNSGQTTPSTGGQTAVTTTGSAGATPDSPASQTIVFRNAMQAMTQGNVGTLAAPVGPIAPSAPKPQANNPTVLGKFPGLNFSQDGIPGQPPDSNAAAGPNSVINTVNQQVAMYRKSGTQIATIDFGTFWASLPNGGQTPPASHTAGLNEFSDPLVVYDELAQRFIIEDQYISSGSGDSVQDIAVSKSSNPTSFSLSDWTLWQFRTGEGTPGTPSANWSDFPGRIGFNADVVVFTFNQFASGATGAFVHAQVDVLNKANLLSGTGGTISGAANLNQFDTNNNYGTLNAADMHGSHPNDPMYFLTNNYSNYGNSINVIKLANPMTGNAGTWQITSLTVNSFTAIYKSGIYNRLTNQIDSRMISASERNGVLVGAQTIVVGSHEEARWYKVSLTGTPSLMDEGNIAPVMAGGDTYYPSIDIDPQMNLGMTFMESVGTKGSPGGEFPSMYIAGRTPGDPTGQMETPVLVFAGTADNGGSRGGDMSSTGIDPVNGTFWSCNEYITNGAGINWAQGIANFRIGSLTATGVFFTDGINQLWLFQNGVFTNTGAFASVFSAGIDQLGNPECWFLDGNHQLWRDDNGVFTNTGAFAQKIAAGAGFVAFTDGVNQLWTFVDGGNFTNTGGFASRFTASFDASGNNQIIFADGINQLWTYNATTVTFTNTGGFTKLFTAGQDASGKNEIWFTDGNNRIWRLDQGTFTQMAPFALQITGSAQGQMYFVDGINQIWSLTDAGVSTNTGGFAETIASSPGTTALFFTDGINQIWQFKNGTFTNTGGFATKFSAF
jgi:hypothetical protein